ncbi:MAG TPA: serine hydrolase domain-containing protein [Streptosporangiaceae bacterium]|nr:serine hydrolase domain-containing protein [Streptosporangiaceae bacterium]
MSGLREVLQESVDDGSVPGAVGLVARGDQVEIAAVGSLAYGGAPMPEDAIFRIASITKPITAAAVMLLVDDGRIALDDPVDRWLPELASPMVVRTPASPVDDVVPAVRPIAVLDLLSSMTGYGWPSDFTLPQVQRLFPVQRDGREPASYPPPDTWMAELAALPLLYQPGEAWLYDTSSVLQGVLVTRVSGQPFSDFLAERVFEPLGMADSAFYVPAGKRDRLTSYYRPSSGGAPELADGPDGQWSAPPAFPLGHGGLAGTAADWLAFGRMLLAGGTTADGRRVLSAESVRLMTTDHTSTAQRAAGQLFLDGQGWGFGGGVDIARIEPWNVLGRYGWVGGTGTSAHVIPSTGTVAILLTQVGVDSPVPVRCLPRFWRYTAAA